MSVCASEIGIEFLEVSDLAQWLHVSVKTIYNLIHAKKKGKVGISSEHYLKVGKKILFVKSKVVEAVQTNNFIS